jgi:hypothetical protein
MAFSRILRVHRNSSEQRALIVCALVAVPLRSDPYPTQRLCAEISEASQRVAALWDLIARIERARIPPSSWTVSIATPKLWAPATSYAHTALSDLWSPCAAPAGRGQCQPARELPVRLLWPRSQHPEKRPDRHASDGDGRCPPGDDLEAAPSVPPYTGARP